MTYLLKNKPARPNGGRMHDRLLDARPTDPQHNRTFLEAEFRKRPVFGDPSEVIESLALAHRMSPRVFRLTMAPLSLEEVLDAVIAEKITAALSSSKTITAAARQLGISQPVFSRHMKRLHIKKDPSVIQKSKKPTKEQRRARREQCRTLRKKNLDILEASFAEPVSKVNQAAIEAYVRLRNPFRDRINLDRLAAHFTVQKKALGAHLEKEGINLRQILDGYIKELILCAIETSETVSEAARALGIQTSMFYAHTSRLGIKPAEHLGKRLGEAFEAPYLKK